VDVSKSVVAIMGFTIENKRFVEWLWVKRMEQCTSLTCFLTEDEVLMSKKTHNNIDAKFLTLSIFTVTWAMWKLYPSFQVVPFSVILNDP